MFFENLLSSSYATQVDILFIKNLAFSSLSKEVLFYTDFILSVLDPEYFTFLNPLLIFYCVALLGFVPLSIIHLSNVKNARQETLSGRDFKELSVSPQIHVGSSSILWIFGLYWHNASISHFYQDFETLAAIRLKSCC